MVWCESGRVLSIHLGSLPKYPKYPLQESRESQGRNYRILKKDEAVAVRVEPFRADVYLLHVIRLVGEILREEVLLVICEADELTALDILEQGNDCIRGIKVEARPIAELLVAEARCAVVDDRQVAERLLRLSGRKMVVAADRCADGRVRVCAAPEHRGLIEERLRFRCSKRLRRRCGHPCRTR